MQELIAYLLEKLAALPADGRFMLGIVGFPGAGKSTLAENLVKAVNARQPSKAAVVPMDGFHLQNKVLDELNLRPLKGIPETFDGKGFVALLDALKQSPSTRIECPTFDRSIDEPLPGGMVIEPSHQLLVVEGNYLLLNSSPWDRIATILDEVWYIDIDIDTIVPRLIERHVTGGRSRESAQEKVESTDLRNARLIASTRSAADRIITGRICPAP